MKNLNLFLTISIGLFISFLGMTQQTSLNTLYNQNNYLVNPAAAGLQNCFSAYLNHRSQWVGIDESPTRNALTLDGRLIGAHGLGLDTRMHQAGLLRSFNVKLTYAYHLTLAEKAKLSFGVSLGLIQQSFAFSEAIVTDYTDNLLVTGNQSDMGFSSDAGLLLSTPRLKLGLAIPQVFSRGLLTESGGESSEFKLVQHYLLHGSYDLVSSEKWRLTPTVLYKNAALIGHQLDVGLGVAWKNTIGIGAMYRTSYGVIGMVDLNVKDKFKLAYGYGFGGGALSGLTNGSHEIMLGIKLCRKEKPIIETEILVEKDTIKEIQINEDLIIEEVRDSVTSIIDEVGKNDLVKVVLNLDSLNKAFAVDDRLIIYELNSAEEVNSNNDITVTKMAADILKNNTDLSVIVIGHTCDIGTDEKNQEISKNRAEDIRDLLIEKGVSEDKIKIEAKGESRPKVPNTSDSNRSKNRRVQLVFER